MNLPISVVVPTRGRPRLLGRCLMALSSQDLAPEEFEVVVVDDGASPATERVVKRWASLLESQGRGPAIRYLAQDPPGSGPAAARNRGWLAARGRVLAFTDDDCLPRPDWLRKGLAAMGESMAGVSGRIIMPLPVKPRDYHRSASWLERAEFATANCFYRREPLAEVGGFDERFREAWREDSDLYFTLLERGHRLGRAPEAVVVHPPRQAPWGVSLKQERKIRFDALLYKKHPLLFRQRIRPAPPWSYYGTMGASVMAMGSFAGGLAPLAWLGVGLWAFLTARFCLRRLRGTARSPSHLVEIVVTSVLIPPLSVFWRLMGSVAYRVIYI